MRSVMWRGLEFNEMHKQNLTFSIWSITVWLVNLMLGAKGWLSIFKHIEHDFGNRATMHQLHQREGFNFCTTIMYMSCSVCVKELSKMMASDWVMVTKAHYLVWSKQSHSVWEMIHTVWRETGRWNRSMYTYPLLYRHNSFSKNCL
jgi:hypothetical protein